METRYKVLRIISRVYKFLAYVVGIGGSCLIIIGGITITKLINSNPLLAQYNVFNWITVVGYLFTIVLVCISLVATSEAIKVFIDIEENTRTSAHALKNIELGLKK